MISMTRNMMIIIYTIKTIKKIIIIKTIIIMVAIML